MTRGMFRVDAAQAERVKRLMDTEGLRAGGTETHVAAERVYDKFNAQLVPLLGEPGVRALFARSAKLAQGEISCFAEAVDFEKLDGPPRASEVARSRRRQTGRGDSLCDVPRALTDVHRRTLDGPRAPKRLAEHRITPVMTDSEDIITTENDETERKQIEDRFAKAFAERTALALENARLFEDALRATDNLREANQQMVKATIQAQELAEQANAARERSERSERELREVAEFRERFIGIVGHDLRNPLSAINMTATSLLQCDRLGEPDKKRVARILRCSQRMTRMISQLLDLTRARLGGGFPLELRTADLGDVCRGVVDEFGGAINLRVDGDLTGTWDPDRLAEVVSNITGNALEHAAPGTRVVVTTLATFIPAERGAGPRAVRRPRRRRGGRERSAKDAIVRRYLRGRLGRRDTKENFWGLHRSRRRNCAKRSSPRRLAEAIRSGRKRAPSDSTSTSRATRCGSVVAARGEDSSRRDARAGVTVRRRAQSDCAH